MSPKSLHTAWPGPASGEVTGPGQADQRRAEKPQSPRLSPSSPGLCETCSDTGHVPAWDPIVEAYLLSACPDCEAET